LKTAWILALLGLAAQSKGFDPGPGVGATIPPFVAPDQDGRPRSFADLTGPEGLVLLFYRSADW